MYRRTTLRLEMLQKIDRVAWQRYEAREMWERDVATRRYEAERRGFLKGYCKSIIKQSIDNAIAFLDIADDVTIANKVSLPLEIVQRLRAGEDAESIKEELLAEKIAAYE